MKKNLDTPLLDWLDSTDSGQGSIEIAQNDGYRLIFPASRKGIAWAMREFKKRTEAKNVGAAGGK